MTPPDDVPDPLTNLAAGAGATAELFNAYVAAGMPPMAVAVMLGQWMAAAGGQQPGDDDT
jgi:hypothetical protein